VILLNNIILVFVANFCGVKCRQVRFNYDTETWENGVCDLPNFRRDYVLLTPSDILTKDETWINRL
jgi:hypothetical protein